jgi:hypothetical protein
MRPRVREAVAYLVEENRVWRRQLGEHRPALTMAIGIRWLADYASH